MPPSELAPADTMLTTEMCYVAFRINNHKGVFDLKAYGTRATKSREGNAARASVELLVAECFRRKVGEARNWSRSKALEKLAGSSLGFEWDDSEGTGGTDAQPVGKFVMNEAGARVVNYIAKYPQQYRETMQPDS